MEKIKKALTQYLTLLIGGSDLMKTITQERKVMLISEAKEAISEAEKLDIGKIPLFEDIPALLAKINCNLDMLVAPRQAKEGDRDPFFSVGELQSYLPEKPARQTVYGWVNNRLVPFEKHGARLYFRKSAIDNWLENGRQMD
nr:helix-turn-helix domain-containing protein [uncultured Draconibacterium sp.]